MAKGRNQVCLGCGGDNFSEAVACFYWQFLISFLLVCCGCGGDMVQVAINGDWQCLACGSTRQPYEVISMIMIIIILIIMMMIIILIMIMIVILRKGCRGRIKVG